MYEYQAWGIDSARDPQGVVDGDTMHVGVDLGCDVAIQITLRIYGINAPEMSTPEGKAAKVWTLQWFTDHCPDSKFVVRTEKDKEEKFGRYLATIIAADGANFNDDIIAAGHAVPYFP